MPKITALPAITALSGDETFPVVEDDDGTPVTSKITVENLATALAGRAEFTDAFGVQRATMYRATNQTGIADATWTDVDFSTAMFDDSSLASVSSNQFTAPAAGRWHIEGGAEAIGDANQAYLRILKNGTTPVAYGGGAAQTNIDVERMGMVSGWKTCAAGDTFKVQVWIDVPSGTAALTGDADAASTWATFEFVADS